LRHNVVPRPVIGLREISPGKLKGGIFREEKKRGVNPRGKSGFKEESTRGPLGKY